ncbi:MAG: PAS domain-containing protein [Planctomycetes bacterium]|nr:PAS domain-containing protein [Planctomycetota bacterium]
MTASYSIANNDSMSLEEKIERLQSLNEDLAHSLQRLSAFQAKLLSVQKCHTIDDTLDQMEVLLDDGLEFIYMRQYLCDDQGKLQLEREMCPEELVVDSAMTDWACKNQELAILPVENDNSDEEINSILLLPLAGHTGMVGLIILWLELDPSNFSQELSTLLTMLARETAAVIETINFRKRIEETRATISDVVETVPHGILALGKDGEINVINSTLEFMFNTRRGDALGQPYDKVLPEKVSELIGRLIRSGLQEEQELILSVHGTEEILGISMSPMHSGMGTEPTGYVFISRDLKLSREVAKLRELDSMKNDFLSLVSHELRTPLTSIMAYSETLLMEGMVDTEEERKEYLEIIHSEGGRLSRLINDVLDLTKLEAGKMDYHFEELNIADVVGTAIASSSSLSSQKDIELIVDLADNLAVARIDSDRIMQVLMNLISNAIKFTPEGGNITITGRNTEPFPEIPGDTITVSVKDTGIGIAPENLNRVFSKFEQIENIDHHSVGTGLGMPICKQIIEEGHGGKIWIESELNVGTTVFFKIPIS